MKLALPPKIEFHESALKAKMAVMLRSDSSVIENRWAKLDLPSAEELGDKLSKINSTRDQTCSAAIEKHFASFGTKSQLKCSNKNQMQAE
jgi:hypothetical protein